MDRILIILKKENGPRASSAPALGLNTIIFKYVYWYIAVFYCLGKVSIVWANSVVLSIAERRCRID